MSRRLLPRDARPQVAAATLPGATLRYGFALALIVLAVYWPVLNHGFIAIDDDLVVTGNAHTRAGLSREGLCWAFATTHTGNWQPLTWLSHMLDVQFFGLAPGGHHATNVLFHAANTVLLFLVLRSLTGTAGRSAFAAALFAVHPLHVESVAWVAERKDVLSTFFWMLATGLYLRHARKPGAGRLAAVLAAFVCGLMSKPMVVTLPFVFLLLDYWPLGRSAPGRRPGEAGRAGPSAWTSRSGVLLEKTPFVVLAACTSIVTYSAQAQSGALNLTLQADPGNRVANALAAYAAYIVKMLWPANLAVFYPLSAHPPRWRLVAGAGLLLAAASFIALRAARRRGYLATGWFWYLGTLVPVIGLVQVGGQSMADRYTYIPLIGLFILISWGASDLAARWRHRRPILRTAAAATVIALAAAAHVQVGYWRDSATLLAHAASVTTDNWLAHDLLGDEMLRTGRHGDAVRHFRETVRISPAEANYHYKLGLALAAGGQLPESALQYREAVRLDPGNARAHNNLGLSLFGMGRVEEALGHFSEAARLDPASDLARYNIGEILRRRGDYPAAIENYREALRRNPGLTEAYIGLETAKRRLPRAKR